MTIDAGRTGGKTEEMRCLQEAQDSVEPKLPACTDDASLDLLLGTQGQAPRALLGKGSVSTSPPNARFTFLSQTFPF